MLFGCFRCVNDRLILLQRKQRCACGGSRCFFGNQGGVDINALSGIVDEQNVEWLRFVKDGNDGRSIRIGVNELFARGFRFVRGDRYANTSAVFKNIDEIMENEWELFSSELVQ